MSMSPELSPEIVALLKDPQGLIPVVAQDVKSNEVLMLAYMNAESLATTLSTGKATYFSRSRNELWEKGATSGHTQLLSRCKKRNPKSTLRPQGESNHRR